MSPDSCQIFFNYLEIRQSYAISNSTTHCFEIVYLLIVKRHYDCEVLCYTNWTGRSVQEG